MGFVVNFKTSKVKHKDLTNLILDYKLHLKRVHCLEDNFVSYISYLTSFPLFTIWFCH